MLDDVMHRLIDGCGHALPHIVMHGLQVLEFVFQRGMRFARSPPEPIVFHNF